jgi:transmembrane sensor
VNGDYQDHSEEYWEDLFEWFDGECSPERAAAIERWVKSDPDIARMVEVERASWDRLKRGASPLERVDTLSSLQRLQARREALEKAPPAERHRAIAIASVRRVRSWQFESPTRVARIAAAALVVVGGGLWIARTTGFDLVGAEARTSEYAAARGERLHITLPDGSHVTLAPESRMTYTASEGRGPRTVALFGRAYFEVIHNADRPFSVRTGATETDDVGTRFLVEAYPGDAQIHVVVADGEVAIRPDSSAASAVVHLTGGETAVVESGQLLSKTHDADALDSASWAQGAYRLRDASLSRVVRELSRWYNLDVHVDSALSGQRLSITIGGEPPDQLLMTIARATNASYTRHGEVVVLRSR